MCIFNELQAAGLFLALDGTSTRINPSTSGRKYCKLANNAIFIHNESLFVVSAAAMSAFQYFPIFDGPYSIARWAYATQQPRRVLKYQSCCSMGNNIGAYTRYIINNIIKISIQLTVWARSHLPQLYSNFEYLLNIDTNENNRLAVTTTCCLVCLVIYYTALSVYILGKAILYLLLLHYDIVQYSRKICTHKPIPLCSNITRSYMMDGCLYFGDSNILPLCYITI